MGQSQCKTMDSRIMFDENGENGLIFGETYLPEELIAEIFCWIDYNTLLNCQLVCKRWMLIIQNYVWRKKAEITMGQQLHMDNDIPWNVYYLICKKKPFERNLIKHPSGEPGYKKHWEILRNGGDNWTVENPPVGISSLSADHSSFAEDIQSCFVSSFSTCAMRQIVDLETNGLTEYVMDHLQPTIQIREWYSCRWDCPGSYNCSVKLLGENSTIIDFIDFHDVIEGERQGQWMQVFHEFNNYGPGVRKISFFHEGKDKLFWAGHYGTKMAKASVVLKLPEIRNSISNKPESTSHLTDME